VTEQIRYEALTPDVRESGVLTDVFVFCQGDPLDRAVTKIGGLPYRSAKKEWPLDEDHAPLTFVAQICFSDSLDLVGNLPGDVLLIFARRVSVYQERSDALRFEWTQIGEPELVETAALPNTDWQLVPCYGEIYRTCDFPDAGNAFRRYSTSYLLNILEGTKIGGLPRWIQPPPSLQGRFLAAVGSIDVQPYAKRSYPLINVFEPISALDDQYYLMWGDVGTLYLFLSDDGQINWTCQCY
jgi:hypothetical protein